ncbi:MAG TPA: pirin family protein [Bacteroidia bacterium]|nr:pirin family protein [Bacteroidia bacterium]
MIKIISKEEQAQGAFDQGKILERKPIGFPQDGGKQQPYSTLFYWAHAWSNAGGLIGEHPHKGFEIMSFVLSGEIEHYDSNLKGWKKLNEGDVQIIRAGSGITHAEKINPNSSIFQIWFDPDLSKTLSKAASYNDYAASTFPIHEEADMKTKVFVGGTEINMDSKVDYIQEITFTTGQKQFPLNPEAVYSFFILEGALSFNNHQMQKGDYAIVKEESTMDFSTIEKGTRIFIIKTPLKPGFATYAEMMSKQYN